MCENHKRTYGIELEGYTNENIRENYVKGWDLIDDGSLEDESDYCDHCDDGSNREDCDSCGGEGNISCDYCESGRVDCEDCRSNGEIECGSCNGSGGYYNDEDDWIDCDNCEGNGKVECQVCEGYGHSDCSECNGYGYERCFDCDGDGYIGVRCSHCDGTGNVQEQYGVECVSGVCTEGDYDSIDRIFDYIQGYGWHTKSDCGTHIHVGASDLSAQDLSKLAILMNIVEPMIYATLPFDRISGTYAKKIREEMVEYFIEKGEDITLEDLANTYYRESINIDGYFSKYDDKRYYGLNLHSYFYRRSRSETPTIEFRYFDGAEYESKTKAWIDLCIKLVDFAKYTSFEQLIVIGKDIYQSYDSTEYIAKVKTLLGLEYDFDLISQMAYREARVNVAYIFTETTEQSQAV
jgi:hypothetical protein